MNDVFESKTVRDFLKSWLNRQPKRGRGLPQKMAKAMGVSPVLVSQILSGTRYLQSSQAYRLANFIGLVGVELDFFLELNHLEQAGDFSLKEYHQKKLKDLKAAATHLKNRVPTDAALNEKAKAEFYSHWHYSAVRLLTDIPTMDNANAIASALHIPLERVNKIMHFLLEHGLCEKTETGFKMNAKSIHLESESPWIYSRQMQWRQKAMQAMESRNDNSLYYTGPMVLSKKDAMWIRDRLGHMIKEVIERTTQSDSEQLRCLNIDWFEVST